MNPVLYTAHSVMDGHCTAGRAGTTSHGSCRSMHGMGVERDLYVSLHRLAARARINVINIETDLHDTNFDHRVDND
jgi:hypothetical protein